MGDRASLREVLEQSRSRRGALPGLRIHSFIEAEAAREAAFESGYPVILMVSIGRSNLSAFTRAIACLDERGDRLFIQLTGEEPEPLARAAIELGAAAVYLAGGGVDGARLLCERLAEHPIVKEVVLPWHQTGPGDGPEGRLADIDKARETLELPGIDLAAVPVGGGPGPYKMWRIPLWSMELFTKVVELGGDRFYSLPWGSVLSKDLVKKYNLYGGSLPGVVSLPAHQYRAFVAAGAVKITFRSDCALAFLGGMRESLFTRPEMIDVGAHLQGGANDLAAFIKQLIRDLRP